MSTIKRKKWSKKRCSRTMGFLLASVIVVSAGGSQWVMAAADQNVPGQEIVQEIQKDKVIVYLDGQSGNDGQTGKSKENAVKSFAKAAGIAGKNGIIKVCNTVTVSGKETWSLPAGVEISRAEGFQGPIVDVSGSLTLENVLIRKDDISGKGTVNGVSDSEKLYIPLVYYMEEPAPLSEVHLSSCSGKGIFFWENEKLVPVDYKTEANVIFQPNDTSAEDYSKEAGWNEEKNVIVRKVTVITKSLKPEEKPEVTPEEKPEVTPEEKPEVTPEKKPEVTPEEKPEVTPEEKPEEKPEVTPEKKPEVTPEKKPEVTPEKKPEVTPEEKPEVTPEKKPEVTPEKKPEVTPEEKPEVTPEKKPEVTPEEKPEVTPEEKPEVTPEEKPEVTPEKKPEVTPEATPELTPEVTPEATPEPTPEVIEGANMELVPEIEMPSENQSSMIPADFLMDEEKEEVADFLEMIGKIPSEISSMSEAEEIIQMTKDYERFSESQRSLISQKDLESLADAQNRVAGFLRTSNGVTIEGNLPWYVQLKVSLNNNKDDLSVLEDYNVDTFIMPYDIVLWDLMKDQEYELEGQEVMITLPAPQEGMYTKVAVVHYLDDGTVEYITPFDNENGTMSFRTDSFSPYNIVGSKIAGSNPLIGHTDKVYDNVISKGETANHSNVTPEKKPEKQPEKQPNNKPAVKPANNNNKPAAKPAAKPAPSGNVQNVPKTGDEQPIVVYVIVILIAAAAIVAAVVIMKKRKK